ncbi:MAG: hypothetical protein DHS20C18_02350 [Saprospiraceae bacterium]|nr:MAG: hypothetical protein DHS20C18_02350 [Saprospiraceae bacterium]
MQDSKFLNLARHFSANEWKQFGLFLKSPYHNHSKQACQVYDYLQNCHPKFDQDRLNRKVVYKKLYGSKEIYKDGRIRDIFSKMNKLATSFLVVEQTKQNPFEEERLAMSAFNAHGLYEAANKISDAQIKALEAKQYKELKEYFYLQRLNHNRYFNPANTQQGKDSLHLRHALNYAEQFYCLSKLRYTSEYLARAFQLNEEQPLDQEDIQQVLNDSEKFEAENLLLKCYRQLVLLFREPGRYSWQHYQNIKTTFFTHWKDLNELEVQVFYKHLYNYLVNMTRQDEALYEPEKLILYRFAIDNELILYNSQLTYASFFNIAFIGSKVGEFAWTQDFIQEYQKYLPSEGKGNILALANAILTFYQRDWGKTRELIGPIYFREVSFELVRRSLLLRTFYEIFAEAGEGETSLSSHADTFLHFLSRKSNVKKSKARPYKNLVCFTIRLSKLRVIAKPKAIQRLYRDVKNCDQLTFKPWILDHLKKINPEKQASRV